MFSLIEAIFSHQFADGFARVFDERLIEQNVFFVIFAEATFDDFVQNVFGFVGVFRIVFNCSSKISRSLSSSSAELLRVDITRVNGGNVHRHVFDELLKFFAARDEIAFAVDFDHHADFSAHMNIRADAPSAVTRPAFLPAVAIPFLRRISTLVLRCRLLRPKPLYNPSFPRRFFRAGILLNLL
jgi:hypothetical protein